LTTSNLRRPAAAITFVVLVALSTGAALAFQARPKTGRFDPLVVEDPSASIDVATAPVGSLPSSEPLRTGWERFRSLSGGSWSIYLDRRSGAPLLVEGRGIPWNVGPAPTLESLADSLRAFIGTNRTLFLADDAELVFDRAGSARLSADAWQIVFSRAIAGVPVSGERYVFTIGHGNLVSFGAPRWTRIDTAPFPELSPEEALDRLYGYMGVTASDKIEVLEKGNLELIPLRAGPPPGAAGYTGPLGAGYASALVWRVSVRVDGEPGTWVALVDAHTGGVRSFVDRNDYARVKGGVYPVSDDQICPDGCEQPGYPMPFANVTIGATPQTANTMGIFNCTPAGSGATTTLAGPYVRVVDTCGAISQSVSCDADLDLSTSAGTDCVVPAGSSPGNTHSSRSGFYHLNRIAEHGRAWLPANVWLTQQLTDNVNLNQTCNAYWDGVAVNFFKSGGGCNNTGEIAGVFLHEWGHGLDNNDGGGYDNPSEAYADITAFLSTHVSCVGRGFDQSSNCGGYGNACLNCTGIRDQDWDQRANHVPSTPSGFLTTNCPGGGGPCGKEAHCEGYVGAETLWDLAVRDLPASGLDQASAWQLTDKLWYKSRAGSGGNAYNCSLPSSDGCAATSWFSKLRAIDDDDGNLANGTPHAAAIFAAFNRHKIACGAASDPSNQNSSSCPSIGAATLSSVAGSASAALSWTPVANAAGYQVLRNDAGCAAGSTIVATVPGTSFTDTGLANGFTEYYTVQAVGANAACDGRLSNCQAVTPQPFAGSVKLDAAVYSCSGVLHLTVTDANIGAATTTVSIASTAEPAGETVTLSRTAPGSANYVGTINATSAPAAADGAISIAHGNTITATYIDANDGQGGVNLTRQTTAAADCASPAISNVASSNVTGSSARITWTTDEISSSVVRYGVAPPPGTTASLGTTVVSHTVDLNGLAECSSYVYAVESADPVGNTASDNAGGAYYAFVTGKNTQPSYPSLDTPVAIPDNSPAGATSTINVPDGKTVVDVNVALNITHTYDGDLVLSLIPPVGAPITLANRLGGSSNDFVNTVFDDEAATPIASGSPPFTGSFRPESPLSAADGINAQGAWKLKVVDAAGIDVGNIESWTLTLTFPAATCGPHAIYRGHARVADSCASGGPGSNNTYWDAGENVQVRVAVENDGTVPLTGVTATLTTTTPGVTIVDGTASYPNIPAGAWADSLAPDLTVHLGPSVVCGSTASFQLVVHASEGSWSGAFDHALGHTLTGSASSLNESFAAGIPGTWTIVDGGSGGGSAATWTASNPASRSIAPPMAAPLAIIDSDFAGTGNTQNEELITPIQNLSTATAATLQFDQFFRWYDSGQSEIADVDVRSSLTGGAWVNVLRQQGASSPEPDHKTIDITAQAAGSANVQVRFHYYQASYEWYWQVDNVKIDYTAPSGCDMPVCASGGPGVRPVADGSFGTPMKGSRADAVGSTINVTWDVSTCASTDHHLLYGPLATVASYAISGSKCNLGLSGSATWSGVPAGSLWFVIVGDDDASTEGSWGTNGTGGQRGGTSPSGQCGMTARDNSGTCP